MRLLPSLGNTAKDPELKAIRTKASLLVHATSSTQRLVLPLLSKGGQSSGVMKSKSLKDVDKEVSKFVNSTWQYNMC